MTSSIKSLVVVLFVALTIVLSTGCFEVGGASCGFDLDGNWYCDVGDGYGGSTYGYQADFMEIEWDSGYYDDPNVVVTDLQISCEFTMKDAQGNRYEITAAGDVYIVQGYMAYVYFENVGPQFDAKCTGSVSYNNGPAIALFDDDSSADGAVTQVLWETNVIADNDISERNYQLKIDWL